MLFTARPPDPASNLGIASSTCHSLLVQWDPPVEHGVKITGEWGRAYVAKFPFGSCRTKLRLGETRDVFTPHPPGDVPRFAC